MTKVVGKGTKFNKQFIVGDGIVASMGPKFNIEEIITDVEMRVKTYEEDESVIGKSDLPYKIHPKLD